MTLPPPKHYASASWGEIKYFLQTLSKEQHQMTTYIIRTNLREVVVESPSPTAAMDAVMEAYPGESIVGIARDILSPDPTESEPDTTTED